MDNDLFDYANAREIVVFVGDHLYNASKSPIKIVTVAIPEGRVERRATIPAAIADHLAKKEGYSIKDSVSIVECGASGGMQEIVIAIGGGLATNLITFLAVQTRRWLGRKKRATPETDELLISRMKKDIERYFTGGQSVKAIHQVLTDLTVEITWRGKGRQRFRSVGNRETHLIENEKIVK